MKKILAINGSYHVDGIIDQSIEAIAEGARTGGATVQIIHLRDYPIEFCHNCRHCMQASGAEPGTCVIEDGMHDLIVKIEAADGLIFAAPTNFYSITAIFKRFLERLAVYGHWPWGEHAPTFRKIKAEKKPALIVSSCAAPGWIGRLFFDSLKQLRVTAKTVGAEVKGTMMIGLASKQPQPVLDKKMKMKAFRLGEKLVSG